MTNQQQPPDQQPIRLTKPLQALRAQLETVLDRMELLSELQRIELSKEFPSMHILEAYLEENKICRQQLAMLEKQIDAQTKRERNEQIITDTPQGIYDVLRFAPFEEHDALQDFFRAVDENTRSKRQ